MPFSFVGNGFFFLNELTEDGVLWMVNILVVGVLSIVNILV